MSLSRSSSPPQPSVRPDRPALMRRECKEWGVGDNKSGSALSCRLVGRLGNPETALA